MAGTWTGLGYARRVDVHLRAAFPNLQTRIFETVENRFLIVFDRSQQDASAIAGEFDHAIRFVAVAEQLANEAPAEFLREIEPLSDAEASGSFVGLPMPMRTFNTLVAARFPDVPVIGI